MCHLNPRRLVVKKKRTGSLSFRSLKYFQVGAGWISIKISNGAASVLSMSQFLLLLPPFKGGAEFLIEHGMIDTIVHRKDLRAKLSQVMGLLG